jgi:flagellar basal body-associated protein FliL
MARTSRTTPGRLSAHRFLLIELVITTILAVLAAGVSVPIIGSSDAAKKEDRKEDGAPPVAEEQA